jgi:ribonucleoside-diphosphate reductase alpha chain
MQLSKELLDYFKGNELPADIWYRKYRAYDEKSSEQTPKDTFHRLCLEIVVHLEKRIFQYENLSKQKLADFSPIGKSIFDDLLQFNNRHLYALEFLERYVNFDYLIQGGSILESLGNKRKFSSLSNCLVLGRPYDSYSGINQKNDQLSQVMKRRCGGGLDLSSLRPDGASIKNQAKTSCGPVLFAKKYAANTAEVAQNGRRGALMMSIVEKHPDSLAFGLQKFDISKNTGANISVIFGDEFMMALDRNDDYFQMFPVDATISDLSEEQQLQITEYNKLYEFDEIYVKKIKPLDYWNKLIESTHKCAEPGILFSGNWNKWGLDSFYPDFAPIGTNPCSEIPMSEYETCRLGSINLYNCIKNKFTNNAVISRDLDKLAYLQTVILDIIVDLEVEYIKNIILKISNSKDPEDLKQSEISLWEKIIDKSLKARRIGGGFTGLADALAALNRPYSVDKLKGESMSPLEEICKTKSYSEIQATIDLAILNGPFPVFDFSKEFTKSEDGKLIGNNELAEFLNFNFPDEIKRMEKYGRRNISWSTCAPAGTLSIEAQVTSGIEPLFLPWYKRRVKLIELDEQYDFIDPNDGNKYRESLVIHQPFVDWVKQVKGENYQITKQNIDDLFINSPWYDNCANDLDWKKRIEIQALLQKGYVTHAISSTINLPAGSSVETISKIYRESYFSGLKGQTIYREGCRSGVIVKVDEEKTEKSNKPVIIDREAPKRPKELDAHYYTLQSNNKNYSIIIGLLDKRPYEIFIISGLNIPFLLDKDNRSRIDGVIIREDTNWYNFETDNFRIKDIPDGENDEKLISLFLSNQLRWGIPLKKIIKTIKKTNLIIGSFNYKLCKILAYYIRNNEKEGSICPECGNDLIYENGCVICKSCGYSIC